MKILSISAQKPGSTGSGVYLTELMKALDAMGHEQAVIAGVANAEEMDLIPLDVKKYPVCFQTEALPFPVVGMSDEMPYESTRYCDMTMEMVHQFKEAFSFVIKEAVESFQPDLIFCHHLYLVTALVRERYPDKMIFGFCHNTDLRQLQKTNLEREYIKRQIRSLNQIFALHDAQKEIIEELFDVDESKVKVLGMGYNSQIFFKDQSVFSEKENKKEQQIVKLIFAGKIAEKKGVKSFLKSLKILKDILKEESIQVEVYLAGGAGNQKEYNEILDLSEEAPYPVTFLGKLSQVKLAEYYNACDIFVLPSFYEGLPLTVIEALACGNRVVMTKLPGIPEWLQKNAKGADIIYVDPPEMENTDEVVSESLPDFEIRLADALAVSICKKNTKPVDVSAISWNGLASEIVK